ncbi:hypothetical protein GCM10027578_00480 [Spirosoma luteolum]
MQRSTYGLILLLIGFFGIKVLRFQTLGYTFNDMYAFLQMSHSWLDGRPFMYDNIWGYHHRIHNYYTVLLWGPLTYWFGAYGLFAVQAGLLAVAYALVNERLGRGPAWMRYTLLGVVLLGPVAFWLNDHPSIGWHTELTYLPAALLFALALLSRQPLAIGLAGLGVVLIKEDGAILAALIQLGYEALRWIRQQPGQSWLAGLRQPRLWVIAGGWVLVFGLGMVWLRLKNSAPEPRLQQAMALLTANIGERAFWKQMLGLLSRSLLLLLPVLAILVLWLRQWRGHRPWAVLGLWLVGVAVLTALNFVQSVLYFGQPLFYLVSLTWPPRFVLVWGFSAAYLLLLAGLFTDQWQPLSARTTALTVVVLLLVQVPLLYIARPDIPDARDWLGVVRGQPARYMDRTLLQPDDLAVVRCLADALPRHASVFVYDFLVPYFHRQYGIWPTGRQYEPADIALIPRPDTPGLRKALPMKPPYDVIHLRAYDLYVATRYRTQVQTCLPPPADRR